MTTGYTAYIKEGNITLDEFVLKCARAFGALVNFRDDPMDMEIPDKIEPSQYHRIEIDSAQKKLDEANSMTLEEAAEMAASDFEKRAISYRQRLIENDILREKYKAMLHEVIMWQPPTPDHIPLKVFMIEQIESSIVYDCDYTPDEPFEMPAELWLEQYRNSCQQSLDYHTEEWQKEVKRCAGRSEWIVQLKKSLPKGGKRKEV